MRLLFLVHSHPDLQAGGTEIFAKDLFKALRENGHTGLFVAGSSPNQRPKTPGTALQVVGTSADEILIRTDGFDSFFMSQVDLYGFIPAFTELLREAKPDIVHIHHFLNLGSEILSVTRRYAPNAKIVMTLHDYYPMCANDGQLLTRQGILCASADLDNCVKCMPERNITDFKLRELSLRRALDKVDHFISPSNFLKRKFVNWGILDELISVIPNGLPRLEPSPTRNSQKRDRFAFFGHINGYKGATTAVEASAILSKRNCTHQLSIFGGAEFQSQEVREKFASAYERAPDTTYHGPYRRSELSRLIQWADWVVFPSLWWENAPLVISEALQHQRPVICSDIGGPLELIQDGVNGLHFRVGDSLSLAETMRHAIEERGLWQRLVKGIKSPLAINESAARYHQIYDKVLSSSEPEVVA